MRAQQIRILVIDDQDDQRVMLEAVLRKTGFTVFTCENGRAAFDMLKTRLSVDAILCDVRMPDGDGIELFKNLHSANMNHPFFFMSAFADMNETTALGFGAEGFFRKPFPLQDTARAIKNHLAKKISTAQAIRLVEI